MVFIAAIQLAFHIPGKLVEMVNRLVYRGTIVTTPANLVALEKNLQHLANKWAVRSAFFIALAILVSFLFAFGFPYPAVKIPITIFEVVGGFVAGALLGHMAGYGCLGSLLKKHGITLKVQPGHIDGVAGLKPVDEFYFRQAMIVAIPAIYLAVWLLILEVWPTP